MSEYWVSQARHFCKYCKTYIADNKVSKQTHEGGRKHKENVERFLRDVRKRDEERRKDEDKTKRMLEKIEKAAMKQYAQDLAPSSSDPSNPSLPASSSTPLPSSSRTNPSTSTSTTTQKPKDVELAQSAISAQPIAPLKELFHQPDVGAPGPWMPVETPSKSSTSTSQQGTEGKGKVEEVDEDDEWNLDERLDEFKLVERVVKVDNEEDEDTAGNEGGGGSSAGSGSGEGGLFKKRKIAGKGKQRNIRQKKGD
ncbi:hypothetical protein HK102_001431 [Quaeritorhiza haematococci]|nr:hypothetical protein HK102_001431 [Quaeritorhiza haematococci]